MLDALELLQGTSHPVSVISAIKSTLRAKMEDSEGHLE